MERKRLLCIRKYDCLKAPLWEKGVASLGKNKLFLAIQSIVCILLAVLLIAAVVGIYRDGAAAHEADPLSWIFSREIAAERFLPIIPLFFAAVGLAAVGMILGVRDENGLKPVKGGNVENRAPGGKTVRTVLLIAAIALIIAGIFNGSAGDVFSKAVKICSECVGLG